MIEGVTIFFAVLFGFIVQTTLGFGSGLVAVPIFLLALSLPKAIAVISIFNLAFSIIQVSKVRGLIERETYAALAPVTVLGVVLGSTILSYGSPVILKKALGVLIFAYIAYHYAKKRKINVNKIGAYLLALTGGLFSGLFSSGSPPYVIYMSNKYEEPRKIRANLIGILAVTNTVRPIVLVATGVFTSSVLLDALWGIPSFVFALWCGERLYKSFSKELFLHLVMLFLAASAVAFLIK